MKQQQLSNIQKPVDPSIKPEISQYKERLNKRAAVAAESLVYEKTFRSIFAGAFDRKELSKRYQKRRSLSVISAPRRTIVQVFTTHEHAIRA